MRHPWLRRGAVTLGVVALVGAGATLGWSQEARPRAEVGPAPTKRTGEVRIHRPAGAPTVATDQKGPHGEAVHVACSNCHGTREPNVGTGSSEELDLFHQGLVFRHGTIGCLGCHDPRNYDSLKRPDGRPVAFSDVMQVCGQCHGPQFRDYQHGSHGGMTGYWDLSRGGRERNGCTDCHDPHAPAYQPVLPVFAPRDGRPDQGGQHGG